MASDTPLRTVKTVLHSLATTFGYQVLTYVGLIENPDKTELWAYLMKVLTTTGGEPSLKLTDDVRQRSAGASPSPSPGGGKLSKNTYDQLSEIFKKIGTKENTKEVRRRADGVVGRVLSWTVRRGRTGRVETSSYTELGTVFMLRRQTGVIGTGLCMYLSPPTCLS